MINRVIYKTDPLTFKKRVWQILAPYLIIYIPAFAWPLFNLHGSKPVYAFWYIIIGASFLNMFFSSRRWAFRQISRITISTGDIDIELLEKNEQKIYKFSKQNLSTNLKWSGGRPRVLKLRIFDQQIKIIELSSGGRIKMANELETIKSLLDKELN